MLWTLILIPRKLIMYTELMEYGYYIFREICSYVTVPVSAWYFSLYMVKIIRKLKFSYKIKAILTFLTFLAFLAFLAFLTVLGVAVVLINYVSNRSQTDLISWCIVFVFCVFFHLPRSAQDMKLTSIFRLFKK